MIDETETRLSKLTLAGYSVNLQSEVKEGVVMFLVEAFAQPDRMGGEAREAFAYGERLDDALTQVEKALAYAVTRK